MKFPTLYKKTSTGAIQQWTIVTHALEHGMAEIQTVYGQVNGAMQVTSDIIRAGKNAGRSNATTAAQQADAEAKGKWDKKKKSGYVEEINLAGAGEIDKTVIAGGVAPMLAQKFADQGEKIKYPAYVQRKYDGVRCIATIVNGKASLWTRTRKPINSVPHIIKALEGIFKGTITLDGELYKHGMDFERLVSIVRPAKPIFDHTLIEYHVYDMVDSRPFGDRLICLNGAWLYGVEGLVLADTFSVDSVEKVEWYTEKFQAEGFEGSIVRNANTGYEIGKRSYGLQKVKSFMDSEYRIVGVEGGRGRMSGCAIFVCRTDSGDLFNVKMEGSLDNLRKYLDNPALCMGKKLTVRYQNLTKDGIPRFPVGKVIRNYE